MGQPRDTSSSSTGLLHHSDAESDLDEDTHAAAVEAVEDSLGNKDALHDLSNILEGVSIRVERSLVLSALLTIITVAHDAGNDKGSEVTALGADEAAAAAEGKRPAESGEDNADGADEEHGVDDSVEVEDSGPLGVNFADRTAQVVESGAGTGSGETTTESVGDGVARGSEGTGAEVEAALATAEVVNLSGLTSEAPVETHEGARDDEGAESTAAESGEEHHGALASELGGIDRLHLIC